MYPEQFDAICKIPPLKHNPQLIDTFWPDLALIVLRWHDRFTKDSYQALIFDLIKKIDVATNILRDLMHFGGSSFDRDQWELTLTAAKMTAPTLFKEPSVIEFEGSIRAEVRRIEILGACTRIATGITTTRLTKGKPTAIYMQPAMELMWLWQQILLAAAPPPEPPWHIRMVKGVPTAKYSAVSKGKTKTGVVEIESTQPSTEFCRQAFRMIDSKISAAQVRTAINNGRKGFDLVMAQLEKYEDSEDPFAYLIQRIAMGEVNIGKGAHLSLPFFLRLYGSA